MDFRFTTLYLAFAVIKDYVRIKENKIISHILVTTLILLSSNINNNLQIKQQFLVC